MLKSESEMKKAARFVWYEWSHFWWAAGLIKDTLLAGIPPEDWEPGTGGGSETEDALIEVFLLHARALRDFFNRGRNDRGVHPTDILAADFFDKPDEWHKPPFSYLMKEKDRVNRALAHLSYDRADHERTGKGWDYNAITSEVNEAWNGFIEALPEERRPWFEASASQEER